MQLVSPILRADFSMLHHYEYRPGIPLPVPLHVFAGDADDRVAPQHLDGWLSESRAPGDIHWFNGGHFFLHDDPQRFADVLRTVLS